MYRAKLYTHSSSFQQEDASKFFEEFLEQIDEDEKFESLLDFGCGPGETLFNQVLPKLSVQPDKVVGIDILENMIKLATKKCESENCEFFVNDIQSDFNEIQRNLKEGSFDLITSFYCYQWVRKER